MRNCESCIYNQEIHQKGWYENRCTHPDHPGIKSDWEFLNGCSDWKVDKISRKDDDNVYQPRIHRDRIAQLYQIKERTGVPMTVLLDRAIEDLVERYNSQSGSVDDSQISTSGDPADRV